jgi:hypothetical protein
LARTIAFLRRKSFSFVMAVTLYLEMFGELSSFGLYFFLCAWQNRGIADPESSASVSNYP